MQEISPSPKPEFFPENFDAKTSKWFYSIEFNEYMHYRSIKQAYLGKFYIDSVNQVIHF